MPLSIGSLSQSVSAQSTNTAIGGAVLEKSLQTERQTGEEAVDLIQSAAQVGDSDSSGRMLSVYA
jgi:hypothetical protein